ncbi:MAG: UDP-N-acetylmuramoylalanine--D-glutamate ligase [Legionellaceae bacterium]
MSRIIIGLGKTGLSCLHYFQQRQIPVQVMDTRLEPPGLPELKTLFPTIPVHLGELNLSILSQAEEIIISPGISLKEPAIAACKKQGIPILGDIELFAREAKAPIVGITGSNAKSTVTTLVGLMAKQSGIKALVGGNIGIPALDLLNEPVPDIYILELSSFQLEVVNSLSCKIATILNISEDHMDRYPSLTDYSHAKQRIYDLAEFCLWNRNDALTFPQNNSNSISFGLDEPLNQEFGLRFLEGEYWLTKGKQPLLSTNKLRIQGKHNWANAFAAFAIGEQIGCSWEAMREILINFPGLPHRCQWVAEKNGIHWYNDSKGTNVGSTIAALSGFGTAISGKIILIAGGDGKGADFSDLREPIKNYVREVILIGRDAQRIGILIHEFMPVHYTSDLKEAVHQAKQGAKKGDIVLLSPACASIDMFNNYEHRGNVFMQAVQDLP